MKNPFYTLAELVSPTRPSKYHFDDFVDIAVGCFATKDRAIICWEGENYVPMRTSPLGASCCQLADQGWGEARWR